MDSSNSLKIRGNGFSNRFTMIQGKPIQCWIPQEFTRSWEEYAENYCWVASTYFLHLDGYPGPAPFRNQLAEASHRDSQDAPSHPDAYELSYSAYFGPASARRRPIGGSSSAGRIISYYQWAPILLAIQSFFFYLPCLLWRLFASFSGFQVRRIMQLASEAASTAPTESDASSFPPPQPNSQQTPQNVAERVQASTSNLQQTPGTPHPAPTTFTPLPPKSIRNLARFIDVCLMRQHELRRAVDQLNQRQPKIGLTETISQISQHSIRSKKQRRRTRGAYRDRIHSNILEDIIDTDDEASYSNDSRSIFGRRQQLKSKESSKQSKPEASQSNCCSRCWSCFVRPFRANNKKHVRKPVGNCIPRPDTLNIVKDSVYDKQREDDEWVAVEEGNNRCCPNWHAMSYQGNFLVRLHMLVKFAYLLNVVGQIVLLEYYTGVRYPLYGIRVLLDLLRGREWEESGHFPRVTFCDLEARKFGRSHYYTLQCVLPINMFLEKIYIFLWLWFFLVGVITFISILVWVCRLSTRSCRVSWLQRQLVTLRKLARTSQLVRPNKANVCQFAEHHLGPDGVFLMRLIAQNYGDIVAGDTIGELWLAHWQRQGPLSSEYQTVSKQVDTVPKDHDRARHQHDRPPRQSHHRRRSHFTRVPANEQRVPEPFLNSSPFIDPDLLRSKRLLKQLGFPAAMLATEMIRPRDEFANPMLSAMKQRDSDSQDYRHSGSRMSSSSRDDRYDSPPPIPNRSSSERSNSMGMRQDELMDREQEGQQFYDAVQPTDRSSSVSTGHTLPSIHYDVDQGRDDYNQYQQQEEENIHDVELDRDDRMQDMGDAMELETRQADDAQREAENYVDDYVNNDENIV